MRPRCRPISHEFNSVLPDRLGTFPTERSARCERIDAEAEEDFRTIDVAGAGDDRLVHEQGGDRRPGPQDPVDEFLRIRIGSQRVGTEPVDDGGDLGGVEERAGVGSAQIDRAHTVGDTPADLPDDLGFAFGQPHRAVDAQMDVDFGPQSRRTRRRGACPRPRRFRGRSPSSRRAPVKRPCGLDEAMRWPAKVSTMSLASRWITWPSGIRVHPFCVEDCPFQISSIHFQYVAENSSTRR
jgi:hypothetical protein